MFGLLRLNRDGIEAAFIGLGLVPRDRWLEPDIPSRQVGGPLEFCSKNGKVIKIWDAKTTEPCVKLEFKYWMLNPIVLTKVR